jgi:hypothetical protein
MSLIGIVSASAALALGPAPRPASVLTGKDPSFFPIAVWLQSPSNASRYREIGINLYVGLWQGPTEEQITALEKAGMPVVCSLNDWARKNLHRRIVLGWMHEDEPDNAQPLPEGGYGPPIPPERIQEDFKRIRQIDPSRPVFLNLGQGVAWDDWIGRGVRTRHPEDYPHYVKGTDIASFDIYPVTADPPVKGNLSFVGSGTRRLREWSKDGQRVWACIEATHISNPSIKPTPQQTRSMVWMALVHGAQGLVYFSHQFAPSFIEAGILADPAMSEGVRQINAQVRQLAPVLNRPNAQGRVSVSGGKVDVLVKEYRGATYAFAISMVGEPTEATFRVHRASAKAKVETMGEGRTLSLTRGSFTDRFEPYGVHLYRIR